MCGIGGLYTKTGHNLELENHLKAILRRQRHRGPDAEDLWIASDFSIGLCHSRLAILDLAETGTQPMHSATGRYVLVFNGEIYNYIELRQQLKGKGSIFRTRTDSEVLIEAYHHWGEDMLLRLRGMFAFAIYDKEKRVLFCARDRIGKKPFVYAQTDTAFIFASEIPAVREASAIAKGYDQAAIAAMLLHNMRHIPDPHTAYCGIKRLRAGHAMSVKEGQIKRIWRYWTPRPMGLANPKHLREIIEEAISLRMQADVPVGALLSGGVDSSSIVALMQRQSDTPIQTYALGFDKDDEDLKRARLMAKFLGTKHYEFYFNPEEQWDTFRHLVHLYGEPIMLLPLVHTYILCQAVREDGIKVVLTGNGADELFYGYTGHIRTLKISRWLDRLKYVRPFFKVLTDTRFGWVAAKPGKRKAAFYRTIAKSEWAACFSKDAQCALQENQNRAAEEMAYWGELCPSNHYIDESNFVGLMVENSHSLTTLGDLSAMAASVEARAPFLDGEVISFALAVAAEKKIPNVKDVTWLKAILREAVQDLVPDTLLRAPKRGFGMGIQEIDLLRGSWRNKAEKLFKSPHDLGGLLDPDVVRRMWTNFLSTKRPTNRIAKMLAIQAWLQA